VSAESVAEAMVNYMSEENIRQLPWEDLDESTRDLFVEALEAALDSVAGIDLSAL